MSEVYFISRSSTPGGSLMERLKTLIKKMKFSKSIKEGDLVAVKLHFGERGLTSFLRPVFVRPFTDEIKKCLAYPFLTDANTIYKGTRSDGVQHLETAIRNGFSFSATGAPIIIADGINSRDYVEVEINQKHYSRVKIAGQAHRARAMAVLSHFKGHEMFGFGGAVKNIGMGLAIKEGKLSLHSTVKPYVKSAKCKRCGACMRWCPAGAVEMTEESSFIVQTRCTGCGQCIMVCPTKAVNIKWDINFSEALEKTAEYALGVVKPKKDRIWFFNFLLDITPECDCYNYSDAPIAPDIGILASEDPVSIDQASYDLVKNTWAVPGSKAQGASPGEDKFRKGHPEADPEPLFRHAERIGLGERNYKLVTC